MLLHDAIVELSKLTIGEIENPPTRAVMRVIKALKTHFEVIEMKYLIKEAISDSRY